MLRTFWYIALPVSLIFIIQSAMTFIGVEGGDGVEADFDGGLDDVSAPFQLFSFRNLINFLLGFSWTGIAFYSTISSKTILLILAFIVGAAFVAVFFAAFVAVFFLIMQQIQKLAENNSFKIAETIGKNCTAYTPIPEKKSGTGRVQVSVNGSFHELEAINGSFHELEAITEGERIPSGTLLRVKAIDSGNLLIVEKL